ncbi:GyrI-like domain-containing protein [Pseudonocardia xishanensis]|uniref:GyrI-like domain-containing protein n=1 Tax=Pseudonocardia xishanensis TaxID=630995 RepID=A0ABP8RU61_9PSEU
MEEKRDFKRELACYRARRDVLEIVDVPELRYLMIDGHGDPNTPVYAEAVATLYPVAYALKFASRRELGRDYVVMPLEGLWWADDMATFTDARDKSRWDWTMMIMVPDWTTPEMLAAAVEHAGRKDRPVRLDDLRMEDLVEGRCVQALHIGSYDDEAELLRRMHEEYIPGRGLAMTGKHHEIYLSDPRRVGPAKLRTILRQPVIERVDDPASTPGSSR